MKKQNVEREVEDNKGNPARITMDPIIVKCLRDISHENDVVRTRASTKLFQHLQNMPNREDTEVRNRYGLLILCPNYE